MNLFEIWTRNRTRQVSEMIASSFLNYLLNSEEDHGLGNAFTKRFLSLVLREDVSADYPDVEVYPELTLAKGAGRIDGLIKICGGSESSKQIHLVGIEVKIHHGSSINISSEGKLQILRYYQELDAAKSNPDVDWVRDVGLLKEGEEISRVTIVYIVPRTVKTWPDVIRANIKADETKTLASNLRVVPWASIEGDEGLYAALLADHNLLACNGTITSLLEGLIEERPDIDAHCRYFIECLCDAAKRHFLARVSQGGRHATHAVYRECLGENGQLEVYEALRESLDNKRLTARARHTSIGIPYEDKRGGAICRIRTVTEYGAVYEVLDHVQMEFSVKMWPKDALHKILQRTIGALDLVDISTNYLEKAKHADALGVEDVFLLSLVKKKEEWSSEERARVIESFSLFYRELNFAQGGDQIDFHHNPSRQP